MNLVVFTGFTAGIIHVITGVDHLVAIAPTSFKRPGSALSSGLKWGLGHSIGVVSLGIISIGIKDITHVHRISSFAELSI